MPPTSNDFRVPELPPPLERCYWVLADRFLAGAYPGSPNPAEHEARARQLWSAGIRTCINVVEEHETNNSGEPFIRYDERLRELANEASEPFFHLRFPVRDLSIPSIDGMRSILDAIDLSLKAEQPVYVHCFGGVGRTGTIVCCWLLRHGYATPSSVLDLLKRLRKADRQTKGRVAPETAEQRHFVKNWLSHDSCLTHQSPRIAKRDDWKTLPMPNEQARLPLTLTMSDREFERLQQGHVPQTMEDRWFVFFEDGWVSFHRSWTGYCIYRLRIEPCGERYAIREAWVSRDQSQYTSDNLESDNRQLQSIISLLFHIGETR